MAQRLSGSARNDWTEIVIRFGHAIPHYPGIDIVRPARVPAPPRLTGDDPDAWCAQLVRAYYCATRRDPERARTAAAYDVGGMREYGSLLVAAQMIHKHEMQPIAWAEFSRHQWAMFGPIKLRRRAPPLAWVYGPKRFSDMNLEFYAAMSTRFHGSRYKFSRAHRELLHLYDLLIARLLAAHRVTALTERRVSAIVLRTLPNGKYQSLLRDAKLEAEDKQDKLDRALRNGEFLW